MVVEELEVDLLAQDIVRGDLDREDFVSAGGLGDTFLHFTQQHLHVLIRHIDLQLEVIADFRLTAIFLLGDEIEVLDRVSGTDDELIRVSFCQLNGGDIER